MPQTATSDKSSATNPIATARGHTGVNTEDSDHRQNSQPTTGSTAAQSQGPGQNIAGAASVGNIMHTFYSFAPPGLFSNSSKSNGALEPPRTAAASNLPAANLTQAPGEAPPDNLMDTITPKQTHTTPVTPRETVTTLPDTSVTNTRSNCSNSKQGLAASRFAEGGSMGSTPVQSVSGSCFSEPHPRHQGEQGLRPQAENFISSSKSFSAASTLIETNETTPSSVKGSPGNKAGAPHPVPNQAGGSCLIQAGYNCGYLYTATQVLMANEYLIPGHAAGKLLMMTPVGEKQMRAPQLGTKTTYPQNQANYQQSPMATGLNPVAAPYSKNAPATNTRSDNPKPGNSQTRAISSNGTAKKTPKKGLAHSTWA